jgi:hypothetical protein
MLEGSLGEINEFQAVAIWAACRAFRRACRIESRLRSEGDKLSSAEWLNYHATATKLEETVVRHVKAMGLEAPPKMDVFDAIYRLQPSPQPLPTPEANPVATNGTPPSPAATQEPQDSTVQDLNK